MKNRKNIKINLKTIILILLILAILILIIFFKIKSNIRNEEIYDLLRDERYGRYETPKKEIVNETLKTDLDGDSKEENINVVVYEWDIADGGEIIDFNSYIILINEEIKYESEAIVAARIKSEDIFVEDYDEDGINEIIIVKNAMFKDEKYVHKKVDNEIKLIAIGDILKDYLIKKYDNLIKNSKDDEDGRVLFNVGKISLITIKELTDIDLYLYDSYNKTSREVRRLKDSSIMNYELVGKINYRFDKKENWNNVKLRFDTKTIEEIILHIDNENKTSQLTIKYEKEGSYYFDIPYYIGFYILENANSNSNTILAN